MLQRWQAFLDHLEELDLMDAPSTKAPVVGNALASALGVKPGPWMKSAMDACMEWRMRHPEIQDADKLQEGSIDEIRKRKSEFKIPSS